MTDPVSEELARRAAEPVPWRGALAVAVALHLVAGAALLVASKSKSKALSLPSVRVRLAPAVTLPGNLPAQGPKSETPSGREAAEKPKPPQGPPPTKAKAAVTTGKAVPRKTLSEAASRQPPSGPPEGSSPSAGETGSGRGVGFAPGAAEGPAFPYHYYLERVLAAIEGEWFKPPAPPGTRCRVRCRISRSGQLAEAGLEEPSGHGAFDRAALRAVYAAAPFPPLPQGFGGSELVLHLEFVQ